MAGLPLSAIALLILFARIGALLMLLPVFSEEAVPGRLRLLIALGMTLGLSGLLSGRTMAAAGNAVALPSVLIAEILVGLAMGMIVRLMFQAAAMAGSIISLQIGFSSALINDPAQGGQAPLLSKFVSVAGTMVCLALGVHHLWIATIVHSYDLFPVGVLPPAADFATLAISVSGKALALAIGLSAPLLVYGLVLNIALGMAVRLTPAIQVFFIAQPLTLLLGVALLATIMGPLLLTFAGAMADSLQATWT